MKNLILKRILGLFVIIVVAIALGTTLKPLFWYSWGAFENAKLFILVIIYTSAWLVLGAFMGVVIRPRR